MIARRLFRPTEARRFFAVALSVILLAGSCIPASAQTIAKRNTLNAARPATWVGDLAPSRRTVHLILSAPEYQLEEDGGASSQARGWHVRLALIHSYGMRETRSFLQTHF
ncbi:MAG: hypothetical protein ABIP14_11020 [Blastocatellia bacterium]